MKRCTQGKHTIQCIRPKWRTALIGGLALAGFSAAAQDAPGAEQFARAGASPLYCVKNLGPGRGDAWINARGQVAFAYAEPFNGGPLRVRAFFYDGMRLHEIGTLGGRVVVPTALNDAGVVTGTSSTSSGGIHSFVWSLSRGLRDIGTLPGRDVVVEPKINNRGDVSGTSDAREGPLSARAFLWSARSGMNDLGVLLDGESSFSYGRAINDAGMVVGTAWAGGNTSHAFAWTRNGGMVDIDTLGNKFSTAVAVGARGEVAGNILNPPNNYGSIFWWTRATGMRDIGPADGQGTWMTGMSSGGRIVGIITYPDFSQHALTWTAKRGIRDLGTLGGHSSAAVAANNKGQVVGGAMTLDNRYHAFVWTEKDGLVDLNQRLYRAPAGLELDSAVAISDNGSIVANSNAGFVLLKPGRSCRFAHTAGPIISSDIVDLGAPVGTSIGFVSDNAAARYDVVWTWGDGTADRARSVSTSGGSGSATAQHIYSAPGIYTIRAVVTDRIGNSVEVSRPIVVAQPSSGTIAGSGTIVLPFTTAKRMSVVGGKAHFAFMATKNTKAKAAASQGRFVFSLPGFVFTSDDGQVDAVPAAQARLFGTGKVNGTGNYRFAATVAASNTSTGTGGRFQVKIWHIDSKTLDPIVDYDSHTATGETAARSIIEAKIVNQ